MYPWEDIPGYCGRILGELIADIFQTDENETDKNGKSTTKARLKKSFISLYENIDLSFGVGMGYELSAEFIDLIGLNAGMHGDIISVHLSDGEWSYGQDYSSGVSLSALFHNVGFVESAYNKYNKKGELVTNKGFWGDDTLTLLSGSVYFVAGGSYSIGLDIVQLIEDIGKIFS